MGLWRVKIEWNEHILWVRAVGEDRSKAFKVVRCNFDRCRILDARKGKLN